MEHAQGIDRGLALFCKKNTYCVTLSSGGIIRPGINIFLCLMPAVLRSYKTNKHRLQFYLKKSK